jgi:hypothetical protein
MYHSMEILLSRRIVEDKVLHLGINRRQVRHLRATVEGIMGSEGMNHIIEVGVGICRFLYPCKYIELLPPLLSKLILAAEVRSQMWGRRSFLQCPESESCGKSKSVRKAVTIT